jgi:hypothetical protein
MNSIASQNAVWLIAGRPKRRPSPRRAGAGVLARTFAAAGLVAGTALSLAPVQAPALSGSPRIEEALARASEKNEARLPAWTEPRREARRNLGSAYAGDAFVPTSLGRDAGFLPAADNLVTGSLKPFRPAVARRAGDWQDREFARVEVIDGRTIGADGLRIRLSGLELPGSDEVCRTLDGRLEPCAARAATQLELLTRSAKLLCRFRLETASEGSGACRIGSSDLAGRMMRTGYTKRIAVAGQLARGSAEPIAN